MPERTWPELHAASIPRDDLTIRDPLRSSRTRVLQVWIPLNFDSVCKLRKRGLHRRYGVCRAKERDGEPAIPTIANDHRAEQRCPERGSVVAGGWLHVDVVKQTGPQELPVRSAVQGHTSGHGQPFQSSLCAEVSAYVQDSLVQTFLKSRRNIPVFITNLLVRFAFSYKVFR